MKTIYRSIFILLIAGSLWGQDRRPSPPYITGDSFRNFSDFVIDETNLLFNPQNVSPGSTIFVKTDLVPYFFHNCHDLITEKYILITHNSDHPVPGAYASYLDDPKLVAWFGQNVENYIHPKLHPLPIGLENRYCSNGDLSIFDEFRKKKQNRREESLLYMNFTIETFPGERGYIFQIFKDKPFCKVRSRKSYRNYLQELSNSKFVLSPRGNGLDCHRTWEALYVGSIPIVKTSASDAMFEDLPVLIVQDWDEVTEEFLNQKYEEIKEKRWDRDRMFIDYWLQKINSAKNRESQ